jgi:C1A family cysteine protease
LGRLSFSLGAVNIHPQVVNNKNINISDLFLQGSCWAYSTKGVVESMLRRRGINESVSPQQLVDCSKDSCWGCSGGWPKYALDYFKDNGFTSETKYPYFGYQRNCTYDKNMTLPGALNHTYNINTAGNETWLMLVEHKVFDAFQIKFIYCE